MSDDPREPDLVPEPEKPAPPPADDPPESVISARPLDVQPSERTVINTIGRQIT